MSSTSLLTSSAPRAGALLALLFTWSACSEPGPDTVTIELAPDVISSQDGTLHVQALVLSEQAPFANGEISIDVDYVDRNGVARAIEPVTGMTDRNGVFDAVLTGLSWDGTGTVTAQVLDNGVALNEPGTDLPLAASATFSVLDRTPPTVTILPPTQDLRIGAGFPLDVEVAVQDEIGVSEVIIEAAGELDRVRSSYVSSGAEMATVSFQFDVPNDARPGPTITLYALAVDLSGNIAAAEPVVLTVDPAIAIAGADGLDGSMLTEGNGSYLADPRAIAVSPRDGRLYVADGSGNNPCNGGCIRAVDPNNGDPYPGVVTAAVGIIEGITFDEAGDNMYYSDRQNRVYRMSYDVASSSYQNRVACNDVVNQDPQDPMHLVFDPALGILVVDRQDRRIKQIGAACDGSPSNDLNNQDFPDRPWGIALGPNGEVFVSDEGVEIIYSVDPSTGQRTIFEERSLNNPRGIEWLGGGTTDFADSLLVANEGNGRILSTRGPDSARTAVYLRNDPVDIEMDGTTMYILTRPSANDPGRIFTVTGF